MSYSYLVIFFLALSFTAINAIDGNDSISNNATTELIPFSMETSAMINGTSSFPSTITTSSTKKVANTSSTEAIKTKSISGHSTSLTTMSLNLTSVTHASLSPDVTETTASIISNSTDFETTSVKPSIHDTSSSAAQPINSSIKPQPAIVVKYKCGPECKSLKRRLWAAGFFAVLFGVTTLLFVVLLFRQYRISRDENDPAMARLI